jgi:hypothetical protein
MTLFHALYLSFHFSSPEFRLSLQSYEKNFSIFFQFHPEVLLVLKNHFFEYFLPLQLLR